MNFIINTIEGAIHQLRVQVTNEVSLSEFTVYGSAACGCSTYPFEIVEKNDKECVINIPALNSGIYKYQLFVKQIASNKEFLVLEGKIIVEDRVGNSSSCALGNTTIADIAIDGDTVEVSVTIDKGAKGDKGDKGDAGVVDYSVLEPYATRDYVDAQMATVENTVQQVIENTKSDGYLTREDKMKMVQEYYGIDLSHYKSWVIYNNEGGVTACSDDVVIREPANSDVEVIDFHGLELSSYMMNGYYNCYSKEFINFTIPNSSFVGINNCLNLVSFQQKDVEEKNTFDCRNYKGEGYSWYMQRCPKLEDVTLLLNEGVKLQNCNFSGCESIKTITCNNGFSDCKSLSFSGCKKIQSWD